MLLLVNTLIGLCIVTLAAFSVTLYLWAKSHSYMKGYKHAQTFIVHCGYRDNVVFDDRSCVIFKKDDHKFTILVKQIAEARHDVLAKYFMEGVSDCILSHMKYNGNSNDKHS